MNEAETLVKKITEGIQEKKKHCNSGPHRH